MYNKIRRALKILLPPAISAMLENRHEALKLRRCLLSKKVNLPEEAFIEPSNICNLRCPLCPAGADKMNYEKTIMPLAAFKTALAKLPQLRHINMFNNGEPLLNPDILEMIKCAKEKRIRVSVHSNFSLQKDPAFFDGLAGCGLDYLTLSIDGASQATYEKYRVGGDLNLVLSNIRALVDAKRRLKSKTPVVTWKLIVNKFNEGEIRTAKKMAASLGVRFMLNTIGLAEAMPDLKPDGALEEKKKYWLPKDKRFVFPGYFGKYRMPPRHRQPCSQLFSSLTIKADGKIFPCCFLTDKDNAFGDILSQPIRDIWNNGRYSYSRSLFTGKSYRGPKEKTPCLECRLFKKDAAPD